MLKDEYHHSASSANTFIDSPAYWQGWLWEVLLNMLQMKL
jgi:hypothetical protein